MQRDVVSRRAAGGPHKTTTDDGRAGGPPQRVCVCVCVWQPKRTGMAASVLVVEDLMSSVESRSLPINESYGSRLRRSKDLDYRLPRRQPWAWPPEHQAEHCTAARHGGSEGSKNRCAHTPCPAQDGRAGQVCVLAFWATESLFFGSSRVQDSCVDRPGPFARAGSLAISPRVRDVHANTVIR